MSGIKERYLKFVIQKDALKRKKMAFVSGPRQVGKTILGKSLLQSEENYFSWDHVHFRKMWLRRPQGILTEIKDGPIVFDELHKHIRWKSHLKGLYDTYKEEIEIIVIGSARLDIYRKGNDSLLGRYFPYRLHPFSVAEGLQSPSPDQIFRSKSRISYPWKDLMFLGGFPEPLLTGREKEAERWSRLRLDRLVFEDTRDIKNISNLNAFQTLLDLIPERVGSLFSYNALCEDIQVAYATSRQWVLLSETLYYGFFVRPYAKKLKSSIHSMPKYYLYDILQIHKKNISQRLENLTALHLLKAVQFWTDTAQGFFQLHFIRDKKKREVDFLITRDKVPWMLVECKSGSKTPSPHLSYYAEKLGTTRNYQLVEDGSYDRKYRIKPSVRVLSYQKFFSHFV